MPRQTIRINCCANNGTLEWLSISNMVLTEFEYFNPKVFTSNESTTILLYLRMYVPGSDKS